MRTLLMVAQRLAPIMALFIAALNLRAQGTAFGYQGRLMDNGSPATGDYDLQFYLRDALVAGNPVGNTNTRAPVSVTDGLFTVTLDFGAGAFTGAALWLEIGVRTNGSGNVYTVLNPRQALTATPYALYATNAGTAVLAATAVTASSVTANAVTGTGIQDSSITSGKIASGQVVKSLNGLSDAVTLSAGTNITLTPAANTLQISASASGGGGVTWQVVSGANLTAQPNSAYLLTSDSLPTVTLPSSPNTGDVVRVSGSGLAGWKLTQNPGQIVQAKNLPGNIIGGVWTPHDVGRSWYCVASSADGTKLVAGVNLGGGQIYTSTDSGMTWAPQLAGGNFRCVASSADGAKLVAGIFGGQIYTSTDCGTNWTAQDTSRNWQAVASSADGTKLVAGVNGGQLYTSTDSGTNWTARDSSRAWQAVASSADGTKLVAVVNVGGGQIYTSTDSGLSWLPRENSRTWQAVASSTEGAKLVAVVVGGHIYTSTDSGTNWTEHADSQFWSSVASSADGSRLVAGVSAAQVYTSADSGVTWVARDSSRNWQAAASSWDGSKLIAVVYNGQIYTSTTFTTPGISGFLLGEQGSAVELQYIGNGQFIPLSQAGMIIAY